MFRSDDRRKLRELVAGILDAIGEQPETVSQFKVWDAQLGVSAKAQRLAVADKRRATHPTAKRSEAFKEASAAFEAATARHDLWESGIKVAARDLIERDLGFRLGDPLSLTLAAGLEYRFLVVASTRGGWPMVAPGDPCFSPKIGQRLQFTISEWDTVSHVRELLRKRPRPRVERIGGEDFAVTWAGMTLPQFVTQVRAACRAAEKRDAKAGKPVVRYAAAVRRAGRRLFLVDSGRTKEDRVAKDWHDGRGDPHEAKDPWPCDTCRREVKRQIASARKLIKEALKHYRR
jgi:hypothetical protein